MAYVDPDFKSKAELKRALVKGAQLFPYSPGPFPVASNGAIVIEGPHYPKPHRWYASGRVEDGRLVSVK